ncbi:hypothetical protein Tco_0178116 [Tanacetum coccineum]
MLHAREDLMESIQNFLKKFDRISFRETPKVLTQAWDKFFKVKHAQSEEVQELLSKLVQDLQSINEELAEYINTPSWNFPTSSYDDDDDEYSFATQEYLLTCSTAITPDSPKMESLIMVDKHLDTNPKTESDEFIKSSVEKLVKNPSESEDECECDMPDCDDSQTINFSTFFNPLFDDSTTSDDESSHEEVIHEISFKTYSNPLFDLDEEIISSEFNPIHNEDLDSTPKNDRFDTESYLLKSLLNLDTLMASSPKIDSLLDEFIGELITIPPRIVREHEEYISMMERLLFDNSSPRPPEDFHAIPNTIIESLPTFSIPVEDNDSLREEIDIFLGPDDSIPPGIESDDYDSEGDDNSTSLLEFESFHVDYLDNSRKLGNSMKRVADKLPHIAQLERDQDYPIDVIMAGLTLARHASEGADGQPNYFLKPDVAQLQVPIFSSIVHIPRSDGVPVSVATVLPKDSELLGKLEEAGDAAYQDAQARHRASYSASLFVAVNSKRSAVRKSIPSGLEISAPVFWRCVCQSVSSTALSCTCVVADKYIINPPLGPGWRLSGEVRYNAAGATLKLPSASVGALKVATIRAPTRLGWQPAFFRPKGISNSQVDTLLCVKAGYPSRIRTAPLSSLSLVLDISVVDKLVKSVKSTHIRQLPSLFLTDNRGWRPIMMLPHNVHAVGLSLTPALILMYGPSAYDTRSIQFPTISVALPACALEGGLGSVNLPVASISPLGSLSVGCTVVPGPACPLTSSASLPTINGNYNNVAPQTGMWPRFHSAGRDREFLDCHPGSPVLIIIFIKLRQGTAPFLILREITNAPRKCVGLLATPWTGYIFVFVFLIFVSFYLDFCGPDSCVDPLSIPRSLLRMSLLLLRRLPPTVL